MAPEMVRPDALARIDLFAKLSPSALFELAAVAGSRVHTSGELIFAEGDVGEQLYGIVSGFLKVSVSGPEGTTTTLSLMGPGETFGELSLLDGGPRSATVTAVTRVQLYSIQRSAFLGLFVTQPHVGIAIMEMIAARLRRLSERSNDASALPVGARLAKQLLWLAETHGYRLAPGRLRLAVQLSQKELGELISATRESVNKHLRRWRAKGALDEEDGYLVVTDLEALRVYASARDQQEE